MSVTVATAVAVAEEAATPSFVAPVAVTSVDETQYGPQLQAKIRKLKDLFAEFNPPELEVFESPPRQRDGNFRYVMFDNSPAPPPPPQPGTAAEDAADGGGAAAAAAASTSAPAAAASEAAAAAAPPARGGGGGGGGRPKGPRRVTVESFPVASRQLNELMEVVRRECAECPELRTRLFQANFHTTLAGDAMVTLLYHRKLGPEWAAAAERLRDALAATPTAAAAGRRPHVIGRSRKQKLELEAGFVLESLTVGGRQYVQKQVEGAFSQPNGTVCQHMLGWAMDVTRAQPQGPEEGQQPAQEAQEGQQPQKRPRLTAAGEAGDGAPEAEAEAEAANGGGGEAAEGGGPQDDLLELYCGNGNFTVPLAQNFRRVVATEVSKSSVEAARFNLEANGVSNVFLARMASEEFAETMRARGSRRRLEGLGPWEELRLRTILVDPPRAGLDDFTVQLLQEFDRIVYISCNPETLHANLRAIAATHRIARFAAFDQFPYTHHLECGVYLTRRAA
ncbi:hypothetical protein PLESTF_001103400 [Pleodorina starrii]|nr:hypothetical protein PLESTF_001103400 [Pleodorina starrii]